MPIRFRALNLVSSCAIALALGCSLGLAQSSNTSDYKVLGWDNKHIAIVDMKGNVEWEYPVPASSMHDIQLLPNGNILFHNGSTVSEVNRAKEIVWTYSSKPKEGYAGRVTVHAFERLPNGLTMIAESGNQR